jgi:hypothetical protein
MVMVTATWGAAGVAITTVGVEVAIAVGGNPINRTGIFLEAASVGGLFHCGFDD